MFSKIQWKAVAGRHAAVLMLPTPLAQSLAHATCTNRKFFAAYAAAKPFPSGPPLKYPVPAPPAWATIVPLGEPPDGAITAIVASMSAVPGHEIDTLMHVAPAPGSPVH